MNRPCKPLAGVRVLDFSTLLPGPMATLILAEAGAEVIKLERPGSGEDMRAYPPMLNADSGVSFALLNRGKRSLAVDLKNPENIKIIKRLVKKTHIIVEQFRPGVMDRLGLGYAALRLVNPALIYCSITGWGQGGDKAQIAAHDLNYMAETGILNLGADNRGEPILPPVLVADIGGGSLPAVVSILLALRDAERSGEGAHLDIAMADNLFAWGYAALGERAATGREPIPGGELVTGGSPRYQVYRCADGRWLACAPLEQKFWVNFCSVIGLDEGLIDDGPDPAATMAGVRHRIATRSSAEWLAVFEGIDACVTLVRTLAEAGADPHFRGRRLFAGDMAAGGVTLPPLPPPIAPLYRDPDGDQTFPALGEGNADILGEERGA